MGLNLIQNYKSWFVGLILFLVSAAIYFNPNARLWILKMGNSNERVILGSLTGSIGGDFSVSVLKLKQGKSIFVEIYRSTERELRLLSRVELPDSNDAYFTHAGESRNLILTNMDESSNLEIVAPTHDESLKTHLNILKFDTKTGQFEIFRNQK